MPLDYPVDDFFNEDELATTATYVTAAGVRSEILVIFDKEYVLTPVGDISVENTGPVALAKTSDVTGATTDCTLIISGTTYYIMTARPDNTGITILTLAENRSW